MSAARLRPSGSWLAFGALALYGTFRWGTMLAPADQGRLFGSLLVAVLTAAVLRRLTTGGWRWLVAPVAVVALLALLEIAGFRLSGHVTRVSTEISDGVSSLPGLLVPYVGDDPATGAVLVLGAGLLLLAAGLAFGTVWHGPGTGRLALAALPLAALAVVPSQIFEPQLSYVHGLLTFALVALLVLSPRLAPGRRGGAGGLVLMAAVLGAVGAGVIAGNRTWVPTAHRPTVISSSLSENAPAPAEQFNWQQTYGAHGWPYSGARVLTIAADSGAHWKAEDLDAFNGRDWTEAARRDDLGLQGVSAAHLAAYSETVSVTVDQMFSNQIIAAGYAMHPDLGGLSPGADPGTWVTGFPLRPGETYRVHVYAPQPSAAQLASAGTRYPAELAPFRTLDLPAGAYAGVRALARHLAAGTHSPYAYVQAVLSYLQHGYIYTLNPPNGGTYPLVDFLLHSRRGYCQQFAGAMALLLRMHGVPARVAVGFLTGDHQPGSDIYAVADRDAHAWVEVWFPSFGWVTVDPTPGRATAAGTSPALSTPSSTAALSPAHPSRTGPSSRLGAHAKLPSRRPVGSHAVATGARHGLRHGSSTPAALVIVTLALIGVLIAGLAVRAARAFWRRPSAADLTAELERAFALCAQPLEASITLAALQGLLGDSPAAAAYVSSLAAARYGPAGGPGPLHGRAALRRWLARGEGVTGRVRALRALPPRRGQARA